MTTLPILEIIFVLFMSFIPKGTQSFTITAPQLEAPIVWTLQEDGTWSGRSETGGATFESWKVEGMKVVKKDKAGAGETTVDVSRWIQHEKGRVVVDGQPLSIAIEAKKGTFLFSAKEGIFAKMVSIQPDRIVDLPPRPSAVDRLVSELTKQPLWINGSFPRINLEKSASTKEVAAAYFSQTSEAKGRIEEWTIENEQPVTIPGSHGSDFTAITCSTDQGERILLIRYLSSEVGWWCRSFETDLDRK